MHPCLLLFSVIVTMDHIVCADSLQKAVVECVLARNGAEQQSRGPPHTRSHFHGDEYG